MNSTDIITAMCGLLAVAAIIAGGYWLYEQHQQRQRQECYDRTFIAARAVDRKLQAEAVVFCRKVGVE